MGDLLLVGELGSETRSGCVDHCVASCLNFSWKDGDGSADVKGVQGVEHSMGEPLLLRGVVVGSELSSLAPSPCLTGNIDMGNSGHRTLGLGRKCVRWTTVGFPNVTESFRETRSMNLEFDGLWGSTGMQE